MSNTESKQHPAGSLNPAPIVQGKCNCGSVQVAVAQPAFEGAAHALCHCTSCRTSGGTLASSNLIINSEFITLEGSGLSLKSYRDSNTDSGNVAVRWFCSDCGSPIRTVVEGKEEVSYLKTGLFPVQTLPAPSVELFSRNLESFEKLQEGVQVL
ncbi:Mss4-like protein [Leucosporidium creatinivorum]|uniref:Mss4-like protein n=1 Tax=Leucosporidium creatinivorum TaxID=106004 RepID=A0A1Y2C3H5_9BASI|nr:Mss4-like protein [Leucosporidium creatinivorum]